MIKQNLQSYLIELYKAIEVVISGVFSDEALREIRFNFVAQLFATYNKTNDLTEIEINSIWHIRVSIQTILWRTDASIVPWTQLS